MKKKRIIPVLLLRNGSLVQSKSFKRYQNIGNPVMSVKRFSEWAADELIYLDISRDQSHDLRRDDLHHPNRSDLNEIIRDVAKVTFMPITFGGGITTLSDIEKRLASGADKVSINRSAIDNPSFVTEAAREFGSQCIVVSMDYMLVDGEEKVMRDGGREQTDYTPLEWAKRIEGCGAGELLVNSIDRDGKKDGYDIEILGKISTAVNIPTIALGGVGDWDHFRQVMEATEVDAVAAANIFHYSDQSIFMARRYLCEHGMNVRPPELMEI